MGGGVRALVAVGIILAGATAGARGTILFLGSRGDDHEEEQALLDEVAIYTGDLAYVARAPGKAPAQPTAEALGAAVAEARAAGARLAFWYVLDGSEAVLFAVGVGGSRPAVHALRVGGAPGAELHRALALKLRAVLTGTARTDPSIPLPAPALPPASAPASASAASAPRPAPVAATAARSEPRGAALERARLTADYWLTVPEERALLRQGVHVEAAWRWRPSLEFLLGVEVTTRPALAVETGVALLQDVPVRVGVRWFALRRGALAFGLGPVLALHVLTATGVAADGHRGDAVEVGTGLGAAAVGRYRFSPYVSLDVRLLLERAVPRTRFLIEDAPAVEGGGWLGGFGVGLSFGAP